MEILERFSLRILTMATYPPVKLSSPSSLDCRMKVSSCYKIKIISGVDPEPYLRKKLPEKLRRYAPTKEKLVEPYLSISQHQSVSISINQHQSAPISINEHYSASIRTNQHQSSSISNNQHQSASISINQHQSASVSITRHQSAFVIDLATMTCVQA